MAKSPSLLQSIIPVALLLLLVMSNVFIDPDSAMSGANQLSLLIAAFVAGCIAVYNGVSWESISQTITQTFQTAVPAILILFMVGALSGSWMSSGVIPTMIYYGLELMRPDYFLLSTVILTAVVSLATGSSWSTVATVGVALVTVGEVLGISPAWSAGAIISGAYFGDKLSPLSDTTNLAASVAGVDIFRHIRSMMSTTIPSITITLLIFAIMGMSVDCAGDISSSIAVFKDAISSTYYISPLLLLIPALVVALIVKGVSAVPVLMIGSLLAIAVTALSQGELLLSLNGGESLDAEDYYMWLTRIMYSDITPQTGVERVNALLSTRGMAGMLSTVWLIICSMIFAGVMESGRFLERITSAILSRVTSRPAMVAATSASCIMFNLTTSDQYMSIVVPGKMFSSSYNARGYNPALLSRTLEDSATVTSVLIPWNTCGATQAAVLGVATMSYLPFAFFCILSPIMTLLLAVLGVAQGAKSTK